MDAPDTVTHLAEAKGVIQRFPVVIALGFVIGKSNVAQVAQKLPMEQSGKGPPFPLRANVLANRRRYSAALKVLDVALRLGPDPARRQIA